MWQKNKQSGNGTLQPAGHIDPVARRIAVQTVIGLAVSLALPQWTLASTGSVTITVWKTPNCGCCKEWVAHLKKNGFEVIAHDVKDTTPIRQKLGLPDKFASCHTASLGDYVLEGHVPATEIRRLLREKPAARGLAVPGMPVGSPGMEMGNTRDAYDVLLVLKDGSSRTYQSYSANSSVKS